MCCKMFFDVQGCISASPLCETWGSHGEDVYIDLQGCDVMWTEPAFQWNMLSPGPKHCHTLASPRGVTTQNTNVNCMITVRKLSELLSRLGNFFYFLVDVFISFVLALSPLWPSVSRNHHGKIIRRLRIWSSDCRRMKPQ